MGEKVIDIDLFRDRMDFMSNRSGFAKEVSGPIWILKKEEVVLKYDEKIIYFTSMVDCYRFLAVDGGGEFKDYRLGYAEFAKDNDKVINMDGCISLEDGTVALIDDNLYAALVDARDIPIWCDSTKTTDGKLIPYLRTVEMWKYSQSEIEIIAPFVPPVIAQGLIIGVAIKSIENPELFQCGYKDEDIVIVSTTNGNRRLIIWPPDNNNTSKKLIEVQLLRIEK